MMILRLFAGLGWGWECLPSAGRSPTPSKSNPITASPAPGAGRCVCGALSGTGFGTGSPRFPKQHIIFIRRAVGLATSSPSSAKIPNLLPEPESEAGQEGPGGAGRGRGLPLTRPRFLRMEEEVKSTLSSRAATGEPPNRPGRCPGVTLVEQCPATVAPNPELAGRKLS